MYIAEPSANAHAQVMDKEASLASAAMAEAMMQSMAEALTQPAPRSQGARHASSALQVSATPAPHSLSNAMASRAVVRPCLSF